MVVVALLLVVVAVIVVAVVVVAVVVEVAVVVVVVVVQLHTVLLGGKDGAGGLGRSQPRDDRSFLPQPGLVECLCGDFDAFLQRGDSCHAR